MTAYDAHAGPESGYMHYGRGLECKIMKSGDDYHFYANVGCT